MTTTGGQVHPLARPGSACAHAYTGLVAAKARYASLDWHVNGYSQGLRIQRGIDPAMMMTAKDKLKIIPINA